MSTADYLQHRMLAAKRLMEETIALDKCRSKMLISNDGRTTVYRQLLAQSQEHEKTINELTNAILGLNRRLSVR